MDCLNSAVNLADALCPTDPIQHYFTEIILCEDLTVPTPKPDMELITKVTHNFVVSDVEQLQVNLGDRDLSNPINFLRKKIAITGTVKLGIEYSADVPEQEVHFMHFDIPFQGIIGYRPCVTGTLLGNFNRGLIDESLFDIENYNVHVCLEHEQYHQLSPRVVKAVLVMLIWLKLK